MLEYKKIRSASLPTLGFAHRQKAYDLIEENQSGDQDISLLFATSAMINLNLVALILQQLASTQMFRGSVLLLASDMSNTESSFQHFALSLVLS